LTITCAKGGSDFEGITIQIHLLIADWGMRIVDFKTEQKRAKGGMDLKEGDVETSVVTCELKPLFGW
jgi:hypothetical protein